MNVGICELAARLPHRPPPPHRPRRPRHRPSPPAITQKSAKGSSTQNRSWSCCQKRTEFSAALGKTHQKRRTQSLRAGGSEASEASTRSKGSRPRRSTACEEAQEGPQRESGKRPPPQKIKSTGLPGSSLACGRSWHCRRRPLRGLEESPDTDGA